MLKINWLHSVDFNDYDSPDVIIAKVKRLKAEFKKINPDYSGLDTETNGLHIKNCKPFLISFGFANFTTRQGIVYNLERGCPYFDRCIKLIYELFRSTKLLVFFNVKFDLHMLENIGYMYPYTDKITDAKIYIRLAADAKSKKEGGIPETLKDFAAQYISPDAKKYEKILSDERKNKKLANTRKLKEDLKKFGEPPAEFKADNEKSWTMKTINNFFQDKINDVNLLPDGVRETVKEWLANSEDPDNYEFLDRKKVKIYAKYDIVWTLEAFYRALPVALARQQQETIKIEEDAIMPMYRMENVGFKFNLEYALECKAKLRSYIIQRRLDLCNIAGIKLKSNQHTKVKEVLENAGILNCDKVNKGTLHQILETEGKDNERVKEFISTLEEVRTLEKWYSTYIVKWINDLGNDGRVYTQFNQTGAVSGRISSDFQQFPSKPILDNKGEVLFHPRRMIQVTGNGYNSMVYIDFAAEELRFQALYTMLVDPKKQGDLIFCRAFIPIKCHTAGGQPYTLDMAYKWFDKEWYQDEDNQKWKPTDLHTKTTMTAFPNEPTDSPYFKNTLRKKYGKPTNFACVYGASANTLIKQFYFPEDMAKALHDGFYRAYPGIKVYADYVEKVIRQQGFIENLFGRKYYNTTGHLARNYLIQGSGADFMKIKFKEIDDFLTKNKYKSRLQMSIHDECVFEIWEGEEYIIPQLKEIMQQLEGSLIPILADVEITKTTWDEKVDYEC